MLGKKVNRKMNISNYIALTKAAARPGYALSILPGKFNAERTIYRLRRPFIPRD